jgi:hypothetical protein
MVYLLVRTLRYILFSLPLLPLNVYYGTDMFSGFCRMVFDMVMKKNKMGGENAVVVKLFSTGWTANGKWKNGGH